MKKICVGLSCFVIVLLGCKPEQAAPPQAEAPAPSGPSCIASTTMPSPSSPNIACAAPPSTFTSSSFFASGASPQTMQQAGPTFDSWAWASFAAMNWPAKADANQPTGYVRGIPDLTKSFTGASSTDVLVWETFKEKREVFNTSVTPGTWQQLTYSPSQTIQPQGGQVPPCNPAAAQKAAKLPGGAHRRILQASKLAPQLNTGPNSLDETAEVASPAQEATNALCAGYTGTALTQCQQTFPPPSPNQLGTPYSPTVLNPRPGVGPRVYDPNNNLLFYEVRLNYDYFNYVVSNGLNNVNPPSGQNPPAPKIQPPYALPWRTSAQAGPQNSQQTNEVTKYEASVAVSAYGSAPTTPPGVGSIQIKSAWMMMQNPDPSFHTTEAIWFQTNTASPVGVCYDVNTFGLIALHIIQRVHMGASSAAETDALGGTFIFATWEHNSIANGAGYSYVSFLSQGGADQANPTPYPTLNNAIPVTRQQSYPLSSTQGVTQSVYGQLPANSVWRNYRLIGTQFYAAAGNATNSLKYNQPYYLANLVVETNNGLQNFQGLPPNITPVSTYKGFTPTTGAYNPNVPNVSWGSTAYNMGGCMGCHGVAQLLGSNFSFVLLDGLRGAGIDTPTDVSIPPDPPTSSTSTSTQ